MRERPHIGAVFFAYPRDQNSLAHKRVGSAEVQRPATLELAALR